MFYNKFTVWLVVCGRNSEVLSAAAIESSARPSDQVHSWMDDGDRLPTFHLISDSHILPSHLTVSMLLSKQTKVMVLQRQLPREEHSYALADSRWTIQSGGREEKRGLGDSE